MGERLEPLGLRRSAMPGSTRTNTACRGVSAESVSMAIAPVLCGLVSVVFILVVSLDRSVGVDMLE